MDRFGLSPRRHSEFVRQLGLPHERDTRVYVLGLDYQHEADLSARLLPGWQVDGYFRDDVDSDQVSWILQAQFADPGGGLGLDLDEPLSGRVGFGTMLRLVDRHRVDLGDGLEWVECPLFTGPVWGPTTRSAGVLTLTCHSVERRALGAVWSGPVVVRKGSRKTDVIRDLLDGAGVRSSIPYLEPRNPRRRSYPRTDPVLPIVMRLARSMDRQLIPDGTGRMKLRRLPNKPVLALRLGETLTTTPTVEADAPASNVVIVKGAKGMKDNAQAIAVAGAVGMANAAQAPKNLGLVLPEVIRNDQLKTDKACEVKARRILRNRLTNVASVSVEAIGLPGLWPGDLVVVDDGVSKARIRVRDFTLSETALTVGGHKRFVRRRARGGK